MPKSVERWVTSLSNSSKVPSSSRNSIRSRADILPSLCWRARRSSPPPASASASRRLSSASFCSRFMEGIIAIGQGESLAAQQKERTHPDTLSVGQIEIAIGQSRSTSRLSNTHPANFLEGVQLFPHPA